MGINKVKQAKTKKDEVEESPDEDFNMAEDEEDEEDGDFEGQEDEQDDNDFIADDEEAERELEEQRKRERKEARRLEKEDRKRKRLHKRPDAADELVDDDLEVIQGEKVIKRKGRLKRVHAVEEPVDEIDTTIGRPLKKEEPRHLGKLADRREGESSTAIDHVPTKDEKLKTWRDNFHTDDIDDFLFCSPKDEEIEARDMPERLQLKLSGRFEPVPTPDELQDEATWICHEMLDLFDFSKENTQQ